MTLQSVTAQNTQFPVTQNMAREKSENQATSTLNDAVTLSSKSRKEDITIGQAFKALAGAACSVPIETVGNTLSTVVNLPKGVYHAYKTVWNTELIGPVLKTAISALIPITAVAAPVLVAVASAGFGIYRGASEGCEHGPGEAINKSIEDVKYFHKDIAKKVVDSLQDLETHHLPEGEKPYDIRVIDAGKGLIGAAAGATIDGAGVGGLTLLKTPKGLYRAYEMLAKDSHIGPVLKTTIGLLIPPAAVLATPLATVGGAVYGLYKGFGDAYRDGVSKSVENRLDDVHKYHDLTKKALEHEIN